MKKIIFFLAISGTFGFSSCSKCYDCSYVVEVEENGVITQDTVTDEYCTASDEEIKEKESAGQSCEPK